MVQEVQEGRVGACYLEVVVRVTGSRLQVSGYSFRVACFGFRVTGSGLLVFGVYYGVFLLLYAVAVFCFCRMQFSDDKIVVVFYFGMSGLVIKKLSTIHCQLSIHHSSRRKMYLFN